MNWLQTMTSERAENLTVPIRCDDHRMLIGLSAVQLSELTFLSRFGDQLLTTITTVTSQKQLTFYFPQLPPSWELLSPISSSSEIGNQLKTCLRKLAIHLSWASLTRSTIKPRKCAQAAMTKCQCVRSCRQCRYSATLTDYS